MMHKFNIRNLKGTVNVVQIVTKKER